MRRRNGRRRGTKKFVERPTDLSAVLDLWPPAAVTDSGDEVGDDGCDLAADAAWPAPPPGVHAVWVPPLSLADDGGGGGATASSSGGTAGTAARRLRAYLFDAHPGLVYFPAALPPRLQVKLMEDALAEWPEPPARSNHSAAFPAGLPGLLAAARAGLRSAAAPRAVAGGGSGGVYGGGGGNGSGDVDAPEQGAQQHEQQQEAAPQAQFATAWAAAHDTDAATASAGPPAAELLQRLRWVTLGPAFNWTARVYEPERPHVPLPAALRRAGLDFVAGARAALRAATSVASDASAAAAGAAEGAAAAAADADAAAAAAAADAIPEGYAPDAALVNYYRAGDTLGGHVDDAEADMAQPIATLSLAAPAVFLMGGRTRAAPPTALLLRGGDALVLAGDARRCFHGVPRVLSALPPPRPLAAALAARRAELEAAAAAAAAAQQTGDGASASVAAAGEDDAALRLAALEAVRGWRINISIRRVS